MRSTIDIRFDHRNRCSQSMMLPRLLKNTTCVTTCTLPSLTEVNEWQINEIEAAVKEADTGDFANDDEVLKLKPQQVVMEACYSSNYWGRLFQSHGI
jgi:hypothetical protein